MKLWMPRLQELLVFENNHIESDATDDEPTEIEHLKSSVIDSVNLYATRYDEEFSPFLESFVMKIWQLLMNAKQIPRFDSLVASGINFLTAISQRPQYKPIFAANDTVDQIFQNIAFLKILSDKRLTFEARRSLFLTQMKLKLKSSGWQNRSCE